jgi:hypothetical protein
VRIEELGYPSSLTKAVIDDKSLVIYRPRLNQITGSVLATILLQQIIYWANKSQNLFYKFLRPCQHDLYKPGDSWEEELGFTRRELDGALAKIAKKYNPKKEAPPSDSFVVFYTDIRRLTWFSVNWNVLNTSLEELFLHNAQNVHYVNHDPHITYCTERTLDNKDTETTPEIKQQTSGARQQSEANLEKANILSDVAAAVSLLEKYAIGQAKALAYAEKFSLPFIQKKLGEIELKFASGKINNLQGYIITVFDKTASEESLFEQENKAKQELSKQQQKEKEIIAKKRAQQEERQHQEYISITDKLITEANVVELRWFAEWLEKENKQALKMYKGQGLKSNIVMAYYRRYLYHKYYHIPGDN